MIDCVDAIAAPQAVTTYVRPSASIFTVEGGRVWMHVVRGRDEALRVISEKRAQTRAERHRLCLDIVEASVLPERADAPTVSVAPAYAVRQMLDATCKVMPDLERIEDLVYSETPGLDAFRLPTSWEIDSGYAVIRTHAGPLLETFHTRSQAYAFVKRHEALLGEDDLELVDDAFGRSPLGDASPRAPEAFGGFAAAVIGAHDRILRLAYAAMRGKR